MKIQELPASLIQAPPPHIELALDLNIQRMPEDEYFEVEIIISAKATSENKTLFIVDLKYAGIFHLINVSEEQIQIFLLSIVPAIIFFARKIIADVTGWWFQLIND